jgi:hypothetical protein
MTQYQQFYFVAQDQTTGEFLQPGGDGTHADFRFAGTWNTIGAAKTCVTKLKQRIKRGRTWMNGGAIANSSFLILQGTAVFDGNVVDTYAGNTK